jgi:hypothetical protein
MGHALLTSSRPKRTILPRRPRRTPRLGLLVLAAALLETEALPRSASSGRSRFDGRTTAPSVSWEVEERLELAQLEASPGRGGLLVAIALAVIGVVCVASAHMVRAWG